METSKSSPPSLSEWLLWIFNLKTLLTFLLFLWVSGSFIFFARKNIEKSRYEKAQIQAQSVKGYLDLYRKDLRFKLAQWAYNYQLVQAQGIEFDQEAFLNSEFQSLFFFKHSENQFEVQWVKSKDIGGEEVPAPLMEKSRVWTFKDLVERGDFIFSSQQSNLGGQVFFGFPVDDPVMGKGLIAATLDHEYLNLSSLLVLPQDSLQTVSPVRIGDSSGTYLFHPRSEYIGQEIVEDQESHYLFPISDTDIHVFVQKSEIPWLSFIGWPIGVMLSGLLLLLGVLLFEVAQSQSKGLVVKTQADEDSVKGEELEIDSLGHGESESKTFEQVKEDKKSVGKNLLDFKESQEGLEFAFGNEDLSFDIFDDEFLEEIEEKKEGGKGESGLDSSKPSHSSVSMEDSKFSEEVNDKENDWSKIIEDLTNELNSIDSEWESSEEVRK